MKNKIVYVDLDWLDTYSVEVIKFPCPNCKHITKRKSTTNVVCSITCKKCRNSYSLRYNDPEENTWTCFFCQKEYDDHNEKRKICPNCRLTTQFNYLIELPKNE